MNDSIITSNFVNEQNLMIPCVVNWLSIFFSSSVDCCPITNFFFSFFCSPAVVVLVLVVVYPQLITHNSFLFCSSMQIFLSRTLNSSFFG